MSIYKLPKGTRVIVCGSRRCTQEGARLIFAALDIFQPEFVIQGGANGVDRTAKEWAKKNHCPCAQVDAYWDSGPSAGPIRNNWMLDLVCPGAVIAFPGGKGTSDMVKQAKHVQAVEVISVTLDQLRGQG